MQDPRHEPLTLPFERLGPGLTNGSWTTFGPIPCSPSIDKTLKIEPWISSRCLSTLCPLNVRSCVAGACTYLQQIPACLFETRIRTRRSRCFIRGSTRGERISAGRACSLWGSRQRDAPLGPHRTRARSAEKQPPLQKYGQRSWPLRICRCAGGALKPALVLPRVSKRLRVGRSAEGE